MVIALRIAAVAVAIAGLIDPAFAVRRNAPLAIDIYNSAGQEGAELRERLLAGVGSEAIVGSGQAPTEVVLIGGLPPDLKVPRGVLVSTVSISPGDRSVRIVEVVQPHEVLPGQMAIVTAVLQASNAAGATSVISLEQNDIQLARVEHRWSSPSEAFEARLRYVPPATGFYRMRVVVRGAPAERTGSGNAADVALVSSARKLRVLSYEPRPSWMTRFVRRALESDPVFEVSALVRSSRGVAVRTAAPPGALTAAALAPFDAVVVGAPEELTRSEITALDAFARERGGAVVLMPDRRPSGAYLEILPAERFDEVLLEEPVAVDAEQPAVLRASEFALPDRLGRGAVPLATMTNGGTRRSAIVSWPRGAGRMLFAGALDAWRFRARDEDGFARFWTGSIASLASSAQPPIRLSVQPRLVAPNERVLVRASIRRTAFDTSAERTTVPSMEATLVGPDGSDRMLRLWPSAETGVFEAMLPAPPAGRYDVRVSAAGRAADAALQVDNDVQHPDDRDDDALRMIADATGGVAARGPDLQAVDAHLRGLRRQEAVRSVHPLRSPWWILAFAGGLSIEWISRRRQGLF